jgi:hypothetical protein
MLTNISASLGHLVWLVLVIGTALAGVTSASAQAGTAAARQPAPASRARAALLSAPGADTVAQMFGSAAVEVVGPEAGWARVRIEGWIPLTDVAGLQQSATPENLGLAAVKADPERYAGQSVRWRAQYIALQRADSLRSDMTIGESYMLVRDPGGEPGLAYVAVPPALLPSVSGLAPLQRVEVFARIRTGRSPLTGHPILELIELRQ